MSLQKKILEAPAEGDDEQMLQVGKGGAGSCEGALGVAAAPVGSRGEAAGQGAVSKGMEVVSLENLEPVSEGMEEF